MTQRVLRQCDFAQEFSASEIDHSLDLSGNKWQTPQRDDNAAARKTSPDLHPTKSHLNIFVNAAADVELASPNNHAQGPPLQQHCAADALGEPSFGRFPGVFNMFVNDGAGRGLEGLTYVIDKYDKNIFVVCKGPQKGPHQTWARNLISPRQRPSMSVSFFEITAGPQRGTGLVST